MKRIFIVLISLFFCLHYSFSQNSKVVSGYNTSELKYFSKTDFTNSLILGSILVISPTLVLENQNAYFGLSKELSAGKYPFGRVEFDYTYIFRSERSNAVHLSYNFDIPLNGNFKNPSIFMLSPAAGYYTDFTRKGVFVQMAIGFFADTGFSENISIHPNMKFRRVFMNDNYPSVNEISLGVGFGFFSR